MQKFSIATALTSGFELIRREWGAVLAWGGVYVLALIAMEGVIFGPAILRMVTEGADARQEMTRMFETMGAGRMAASMGLAYLIVGFAAVILYGAIARAHLQPDERRGFYMRLSLRELWLGLTALALVVFMLVLSFLAIFVVSIASTILSVNGGELLLVVPLGIAVAVGCLYIVLRFSLAWLIAWDEKKFAFFASWRLTKGLGWRLVLLYLCLIFVMLAALVGVGLLVMVVGLVLTFIASASDGVGAVAIGARIVSALILLPLYVAILGATVAIAGSPWVDVYRRLRPTAAESLAEVF